MKSQSVTTIVISAVTVVVASVAWILHAQFGRSTTVIVNDPMVYERFISQWVLLGPFGEPSIDSDDDALAIEVTKDYLSTISGSEASLAKMGLHRLCALSRRCRTYRPAHGLTPLYQLFPESNISVVYATTTIESAAPLKLVLDTNVIPGAVWLNGYKVVSFGPAERGGTGPQTRRLIPLQLRSGTNVLMIKTLGKGDQRDWALSVRLLPESDGGAVWLSRRSGNLVARHLLAPSDHIALAQPSIEEETPITITVTDIDGAIRLRQVFYRWPDSLERVFAPGYYSIIVTTPDASATDELYLGNPNVPLTPLFARQKKAPITSQAFIQRDPLLQRYTILMSPQYFHPADQTWQRKMVLVAHDAILAQRSHEGSAAWTTSTGFHFREYISRVDNSRQPYLIYLPQRKQATYPLVVEMPYVTKIAHPFLESGLALAYPDALQDLKEAADDAGFAVAVIDGRGNAGFSAIGESDALEVISDLASALPLDESRIYLYGTCEGGARALKLAEDYPSVFAAVGVYGPALDTQEGWMANIVGRKQGLFVLLPNLKGVPVHVEEGQFDDVPSRSSLVEFMQRLDKLSNGSTLKILQDGLHGTNAAEARVFPWFGRFSRPDAEESITAATSDVLTRASAGAP